MKNRNRIFAILMSLAMLLGVFALAIPVAADDDYVEITPNTNFVYNGITYRFDVNSANTQGDTYARINPDGTIDVRLRHGDMLWFPDLQMTSSTTIHAEVTALVNMTKRSSGLAYAVRPDESGKWENAMIADVRNDGRVRIAAVSYTGLGTVSGSDYGNGGDYKVWAPNRGQGDDVMDAIITTDAHKAIELGSTASGASLYDWAKEKPPVSFDVSNSDGTVTVEWGVPDIGSFAEYSYETASNASLSYTGSVGYTHDWADSSWQALKVRIERLTVTNCTVGGNATAVWDAVDRESPIMGFADEPVAAFEGTGAEIDFEFDVDSSVPETAELVVKRGTTEIARSALSTLTKGAVGYLWKAELENVVNTDFLNFSLESAGTLIERSELTYTLGAIYQAYLDSRRSLIVEDSTVEIETGIAFFTWKITLTEYVPAGAKLVMKKNGTTVNTVELNTLIPDTDGFCTVEYYINCESETDVLTLCLEADNAVVAGSETFYAYGAAWEAATATVAPIHSSELNCKAYEIDFSTVADMTLEPGENIVAGYRWIYIRNSEDGVAEIKNGKLRIKGSKGDMIIFDDLNLNKTNFRFVSEVTYLNVPAVASWDDLEAADVQAYQAYNAYFGHLVHLSEADADGNRTAFIQSCTPNGAYLIGATINPNAEAGSVIKPNRIGEGESAYDDITKAKLQTRWYNFRGDDGIDVQYFNGALGYGSPMTMRTFVGISNNGYGKIGLTAAVASGSGGQCYANMASRGASVTLESRVGKMGYICSEDEVEVSVGKLSFTVKSTSSMTVDGEQFPIYGDNEITVASLAKGSNKVIYAQLGNDILYPESKFIPNRLTVVTTKQVNLVSRKATANGKTGLKWKFEIDKAGYDALLADPNVASVKVGLLIIPTTFAEDGISRATFALAGSQGIDLDITASKVLDDTVYVFNGVRDVAENERTISYSAVGYIQVTMADDHVVEQIADFSVGKHSGALASFVSFDDQPQEQVTTAPAEDATAPTGDVTTTAPKKDKKGCKGSVAGFAMIAVLTLAGASCACFKKKD